MDKKYIATFHLAARDGLHKVLSSMLSEQNSESINMLLRSTSGDSRTPLHYAIEQGHTESVGVLLEHGADPTAVSGHHPMPIHLACLLNKLKMVKMMVEKCGESVIHSRQSDDKTTLHSSVNAKCCSSLISYIVSAGVGVNEADSNGATPLSRAVEYGSVLAVESLLKQGGDPLIVDHLGHTGLHKAVVSERIEIFKKMASLDATLPMAKTADAQGYHPIHHALKRCLHDMVVALLEITSDTFNDKNGNNFLHLAATSSCDEKTFTHLLAKPFARWTLNQANAEGSTPLHSAARGSKTSIVKSLLNHGAVINRDRSGCTPFMCACSAGNLATAKLLFKGGEYQKNWVDHNGCSALHLAVEGKNPEVITFCLDKEVDVTFNKHRESFFERILALNEKKMAIAAVSHRRWEECIDMHSPDLPHPILRILDQMPEVYQILLDKSHTRSTLSSTHPDYWEEFNFKCLDVTLKKHQIHLKSVPASTDTIELTEFDDTASSQDLLCRHDDPGATQGVGSQRKHVCSFSVLERLVKHQLESYLLHPIVWEFLKMKWARLGFLFQLTTLGIPFLLAMFFSIGAVIMREESNLLANMSGNNTSDGYSSLSSSSQALLIVNFFFAFLSLLHFVFELYVEGSFLLFNFTKSIHVWTNFMASSSIIVFLLSVVVVGLGKGLWDAAAVGVLFAWFTVGTSLQFVQLLNIGVYITMMISTMKLVVIVTTSLLMFLLGFTFAFYIVFESVESLQYGTVGLSMFSTFHSLIATIEFTEFIAAYRSGELRYSVLVFLLLVLLIVMLPIVFINLLIGLAIGDIDRIQREAAFTRQSIEIHALSSVDKKFIPRAWTKRFAKTCNRVYPNRPKWMKKIFHHYFIFSDEKDKLDSLYSTVTERLTDNKELLSEIHDNLERKIDHLEKDGCLQTKHLQTVIEANFKQFEVFLDSPKK